MSQELLKQALALPAAERAQRVLRLAESLDNTVEQDGEAGWAVVVAQRIEEVRRGSARIVSGDEALAKARERIARR